MNATLKKFGYPESTVWKDDHWAVLLRPQQVTLASLVLCTLSDATSFTQLPVAALAAYGKTLQHVERALQQFRPYNKLNVLTLMMVDPHVHSHILPRYAVPQSFGDAIFHDQGWPAAPDLKSNTEITEATRAALRLAMEAAFTKTSADAEHA